MTAEQLNELNEAKDRVAKNHHYELFRQETGGWTRFDKLYGDSQIQDRKALIDEVAIEYNKATQEKLNALQENINKIDWNGFEEWKHLNKYNTSTKYIRQPNGELKLTCLRHWKTDTGSSPLFFSPEQLYKKFLIAKEETEICN